MDADRRETLGLILGAAIAAAAPAWAIRPAAAQAKTLRIGLLVKVLGTAFFDAVHTGSLEAAKELGNIDILYVGPAKPTAEAQIQVLDSLVAQHPDAIMISADDPVALGPVCKKAMQRGIKIVSFDAAVAPEGRILQLDPADKALVGAKCVQMMAKTLSNEGEVAILSGSEAAANQSAWIAEMKREWAKPEYDKMKLVATVHGDDNADKSYREAQGLLKAYPNLKGIIAPTTVGIVAAAKAVVDQGLVGRVHVTGLGLPSEMKSAVQAGATDTFTMWNPIDLGYTITMIAGQIAMGTATGAADTTINAGRMGQIKIAADHSAAMAEPFLFDKSNIEQFAQMF